MSTPNQALTDLKKGKVWPVYFLHGEEPYKISEFVSKLSEIWLSDSQSNSYNIEKLDGTDSTGNDILNSIQSMGLFSTSARRIVVVRQASAIKELDVLSGAIMAEKASDGEGSWGGNLLVLLSDGLDGRKKFHQWLKKAGYALEFKKATDAELFTWIEHIAKKMDVKVDKAAAEVLAVRADGSLNRLASEMEKAWLYMGANPGVTLDLASVSAITSSHVTHEMVELVDSILQGKKTRALLLCEKIVTAPDEAIGLTGFLTWSIKNVNTRPGSFGGSGANLPLEKRKRFLQALIELDLRLKSSHLDARSIVEEFIVAEVY